MKSHFYPYGRPPRILVVGGNFAGLSAAVHLPKRFEVTVFDPGEAFEFLPNIHELVSGFKHAETLGFPRRDIVERAGHRFVQERVVAIDPKSRFLRTEMDREHGYDWLVVASGGANQTFGVPGAETHALPFKTVADCAAIGARLERLRSRSRTHPSSVVVVGGGIEGVEALGEILRSCRNCEGMSFQLVDAADRLLSSAPSTLDRAVRLACRPYRVEFHTGMRVTRVEPRELHLADGSTLRSDLTVWTGGVGPSPLLHEFGLAPTRGRFAPVRDTLLSELFDDIFVLGDAAGLPPELGKQAYHALDMGSCAARNLVCLAERRPLVSFKPSTKPMVVSFGDLDTFLVFEDFVLAGPALGPIKEAIFQGVMARLDPPVDKRSASAFGSRLMSYIQKLFVGRPRGIRRWARSLRLRLLR